MTRNQWQPMSLASFNTATEAHALNLVQHWCAAPEWAQRLCNHRPFDSINAVLDHACAFWQDTKTPERLNAFAAHPVIGDIELLKSKFASQANAEQGQVLAASDSVIRALAQQNKAYSEKHGFTFIVFATGKSAEEMLELLNGRIDNSRDEEIVNATQEQEKILRLRLQQTLTTE